MFRVTPAQLQASGGQVRCGNCGTVFDAFPSLTTVADAALKASEPGVVQDAARAPDAPARAGTLRDTPGGERVAEWTPDVPALRVGAESSNAPMAVDHLLDLPDAGSLQGSGTTDEMPRVTADARPQPQPQPPRSGDIVDPSPQFAPELTDYSVGPAAPPATTSAASRMRVVGITAGLLLAVAVAVLLLAGDRLPAPLAALVTGLSPATLLREYPVALAAALLALLCVVLRRYRATWIVASILLAVLLAGQVVHAYRTQIAAAEQLVIESSDLQAVDAAKPNLIQLAASVRSRAAIDVAFPAIEVTLTDAQDRPLARRVLLPDQYLAAGSPERKGLRAGDEFSIRLMLDTTELRPVGYRLYLFYP